MHLLNFKRYNFNFKLIFNFFVIISNVLLSDEKDENQIESIVICDLGEASKQKETTLSKRGGTPLFSSPEKLSNSKPSQKSDIW